MSLRGDKTDTLVAFSGDVIRASTLLGQCEITVEKWFLLGKVLVSTLISTTFLRSQQWSRSALLKKLGLGEMKRPGEVGGTGIHLKPGEFPGVCPLVSFFAKQKEQDSGDFLLSSEFAGCLAWK